MGRRLTIPRGHLFHPMDDRARYGQICPTEEVQYFSGDKLEEFVSPCMFPDGPRKAAPKVRDSNKFRGLVHSCTYAYAPTSSLQWTAKLMVRPVMMVVVIRLTHVPELTWKLLIHNTDKFTILVIIFFGIFLPGRVCLTACVYSLTTPVCQSSSGTCSYPTVIFKYILVLLSLIVSISLLPFIKLTTKPYLA